MSETTEIQRVMLIACEGLDWPLLRQQVKAGNLPNLERLMNAGASGPLSGMEPIVPAALWTSMATGLRPELHGVFGSQEPNASGQGIVEVGAHSLRAPTWWQLLDRAARRTHILGWPMSHPAQVNHGTMVSDHFARARGKTLAEWPLPDAVLCPTAFAADFQELRLHPTELAANDLEAMIPGVAELDLRKDPRAWNLACALSQSVTMNAVATFTLQQADDWDGMAVFLPGLGQILADFLPYHSPRMQGVSQQDFDRYQQVVIATLQLHDQMVGTLANMAGEEALVVFCSGYGYPSGADRLIAAPGEHLLHIDQRRQPGAAVVSGPGVKAGESLFGAHILDVAPTLLAAARVDLPVGLQGRVWAEAFEGPLEVTTAPAVEALTPIRPADIGSAPEVSEDSPIYRAWSLQVQNLYHLALFHLNAGAAPEALPLLEAVHRVQPWRLRPMLDQVQCLVALKRYPEARVLLEQAAGRAQGGLKIRPGVKPKFLPEYDMVRSVIDLAEGKHDDALIHLKRAHNVSPQLAGYHAQLGKIYLRLGRAEDAVRSLRRALETGTSSAEAYGALAEACLQLKDNAGAADAAFEATQLAPQADWAHLFLGTALANLGETEGAITALSNALSHNRGLKPAHHMLAILYAQCPRTKALADMHAIAAQPDSTA